MRLLLSTPTTFFDINVGSGNSCTYDVTTLIQCNDATDDDVFHLTTSRLPTLGRQVFTRPLKLNLLVLAYGSNWSKYYHHHHERISRIVVDRSQFIEMSSLVADQVDLSVSKADSSKYHKFEAD